MFYNKQERICIFGQKNANGHVYNSTSFDPLPNSLPVTMGCQTTSEVPEKIVIGTARNFVIKNNCLYATIQIDNTLPPLPFKFMSFVPMGVGDMNDEGVIYNYIPLSISTIPTHTSAFKSLSLVEKMNRVISRLITPR